MSTEQTDLWPLIRLVSRHLGTGWTARVSENNHRAYDVTHHDGRAFFLLPVWNKPGRMQVSVRYPHSPHLSGKPMSITVSTTRDAEAIAKDITRRLMDEYVEALKEYRTRVADYDLQDATRKKRMTALRSILGGSLDADARRLQTWEADPKIDIQAGTDGSQVTLEIAYCPIELAEKIAAVLAESR